MCFLDKELLCWLPGALERAQAKAVATMTNTGLSFASSAAVSTRGRGDEGLVSGVSWPLGCKPGSTVGKSFYLLSNIGALLSLVTVFFSFFPLLMSERRAFLPACSVLFKVGFSVLA